MSLCWATRRVSGSTIVSRTRLSVSRAPRDKYSPCPTFSSCSPISQTRLVSASGLPPRGLTSQTVRDNVTQPKRVHIHVPLHLSVYPRLIFCVMRKIKPDTPRTTYWRREISSRGKHERKKIIGMSDLKRTPPATRLVSAFSRNTRVRRNRVEVIDCQFYGHLSTSHARRNAYLLGKACRLSKLISLTPHTCQHPDG